jgi:tetratricopeptide (TPR) repeat protein
MRKIIFILFIVATFLPKQSNSQNVNFDSLWTVWNNSLEEDTVRLKSLDNIIKRGYLFTQPDSAFILSQKQYEFADKRGLKKYVGDALNIQGISFDIRGEGDKAIYYYTKSLKIRQQIGDKQGEAASINNIGIIYDNKGDFDKAIEFYNKSLKIREDIGDKRGVASSLSNIGNIYNFKGQAKEAIQYYTKSLKIGEEINDMQTVAFTLNNIGIIYKNQKNYQGALECYNKSLKINEELGSESGISTALSNIGNIYDIKGESDKALDYHMRSLAIKEKIKDVHNIPISLVNIGSIYAEKGEYDKALEYYERSLKINEEISEKQGITTSLINISSVYQKQGKYIKAIPSANKALSFANEMGVIAQVTSAANVLAHSYKGLGNYNKALEMYQLFITSRDSVLSEDNQKELIKQEYKYNYEKQKAVDDKENEKQLAISSEQEEKQKVISIAIAGGLALVILFAIFIFNRLQITKKQKLLIEDQKLEVEQQKEIVEEKNQEITDSINYAKRIQNAILPPEKVVKEYLQESFILYKPKDIVAGDFYWMEHKDGKILFAAADCTGHGVPGAMVSVVCNNALNRAVREHGLTEPGEILDKTREIVIEEFEKSDEDVKDGMDIALCSLEGNKLQYAGAHNPLWIIRNGEIIETKANKQPIGKFDNPEPYTTHYFELEKGDSVYIFSDGYVDQFGGEKGKKFKTSAFRELLLSIQDKPMEDQKLVIDKAFENWKGNLEQVDDVCVIGVKI